FLDASRETQEKRRADERKAEQEKGRRLRQLAVILLVGLLITGTSTVVAMIARQKTEEAKGAAEVAQGQAETERNEAKKQTRIANLQRLAAQADAALLEGSPQVSLLLSV